MLPETSYDTQRLAVLRQACLQGHSRRPLGFSQGGVQVTWPPTGLSLTIGLLAMLLLALLGAAVAR